MPVYHNQLDGVRNAAIAVQEQTWRLQERQLGGGVRNRLRRLLIDQIVRPFVQPLLEQQQEYNAAVLRTTYTLAETADQRRSAMQEEIGYLDQRRSAMQEEIGSLSRRVNALTNNDRVMREQLPEIVAQLNGLEEADTQLLALLREAPPAATAADQEQQ